MNNNLKLYQDSKELPFWNYKRIMQTGNFFLVIKGYEVGDELNADSKDLEEVFNKIVQDFVVVNNLKNEEIVLYGKYLSTNNELDKLYTIANIISIKNHSNSLRKQLGLIIDNSDIKELLQHVKVQRSDDLEEQRNIILAKTEKYKNELSSIKKLIEGNDKRKEHDDLDIDEQFINVCVGLEMHVDERKLSLYQYGVMVKMLMKKVESINKVNSK